MNARSLRGLAALALLAMTVPRLCALTVTQSAAFQISGQAPYSGSSIPLGFARWQFEPFSVPDAHLDSVTFFGVVDVVASAIMFNVGPSPSAPPFTFTLQSDVFVGSRSFSLGSQSQSGFGSVVAPGNATSVSAHLVNAFSLALSDPDSLAFFGSPGVLLQGNGVYAYTGGYGSSSTGTAALSLVYNYSNVSDSGSSVAMLAAAVGLLLVHGRRMI